jgi:hypothetical protein
MRKSEGVNFSLTIIAVMPTLGGFTAIAGKCFSCGVQRFMADWFIKIQENATVAEFFGLRSSAAERRVLKSE